MSGQFNKSNFDQNPSNLKKKRNSGWATNDDTSRCDSEVLDKKDIKALKDEKWLEKHVPAPTKKELKYKARIYDLESGREKAPLSKKEEKELKKLNRKYKKLYKYRHKDLSSSHFTLKCCLTAVVLVFVIACIGVFGGYHFVVQPYTGISFIDCTKILGGLYDGKEKDYPINYDEEKDSQAFFTGLQNALYLDTAFTLDDFLKLIPQENGGTGGDSASVSDLLDIANEPEKVEGNGSLTGNKYLDELLADTKFDFSNLKDYDGSKIEEWIVTDSMIAGLMQEIIYSADKIPQIENATGDLNLKISNCLQIRQCYITQDKANKDSFTMQLTIQVKIRNLVSDILETQDLGSLEFVKAIVPTLLPKDIFITAKTTPKADKAPVLGLNSINEDTLKTLITSLDSKLLEGKITNIFNSVGKTIFSSFKQIEEMVGTNNITIAPSTDPNKQSGEIRLDVLQTVMIAMGADQVTTPDFLKMVQHLHSIDNNYENVEDYIDKNLTNVSTEKDFIDSKNTLFKAYGIAEKDVEHITANNFMDSLDTIPELINIKDSKLYEKSNSQLQKDSVLTDKALAQVMITMISKKEDGTEEATKIPMDILELTMKADCMDIVAKLDMSSLIGDKLGAQFGPLQSLIMSIFPENIFVKINVPYEQNPDGDSCSIDFNYTKDGQSLEKTDEMFDTLEKLMAAFDKDGSNNSFNKAYIIKMMDDAIYPALNQITGQDSEVKISLTEGKVQFPTVYELLETPVNEGEDDPDKKLTADQIQDTLYSYYTYDKVDVDFDDNDNIIDMVAQTKLDNPTAESFINRELVNKFFLNNDSNQITEDNVFATMTSMGDKITDATQIASVIDLSRLKNNQDTAISKNFAITSLEFAKLMVLSGQLNDTIGDIAFYDNFRFVNMSTDGGVIRLVMAGELKTGINTGDGKIKIENFASDYLLVQATIGLGADTTAEISINNANESQIDNLLKIINKISGNTSTDGNDFSADSVATKIKDAINKTFSDFEAQGMKFTATTNAVNGEDGFTSINVYRLISSKTTDTYEEGDDELLKDIIYKLNNLYVNPATPGAGSWLEREFDGLYPDRSDNTDMIIIENNKVFIYDMYLGREFKSQIEAENNNVSLIKYTIFSNTADGRGAYQSFITDLGLADSINSSVGNFNDNGLLFMQLKVNSSEIGGNDLVNSVIPENIYASAFMNLSDLTDITSNTYIYINNLSSNEMTYLNRLTQTTTGGGEDGSGDGSEGSGSEGTPETTAAASNSIMDKLTDLLNKAIDYTIEVSFDVTSGDNTTTITKSFKIADFYNYFTLNATLTGPTNYSYSNFSGDVSQFLTPSTK
ncbi:MAG: hypothetical protein K2P12_04260 [Clostridia bacterium]|nr:hypothetical protein [Clostridia bacterium]